MPETKIEETNETLVREVYIEEAIEGVHRIATATSIKEDGKQIRLESVHYPKSLPDPEHFASPDDYINECVSRFGADAVSQELYAKLKVSFQHQARAALKSNSVGFLSEMSDKFILDARPPKDANKALAEAATAWNEASEDAKLQTMVSMFISTGLDEKTARKQAEKMLSVGK